MFLDSPKPMRDISELSWTYPTGFSLHPAHSYYLSTGS